MSREGSSPPTSRVGRFFVDIGVHQAWAWCTSRRCRRPSSTRIRARRIAVGTSSKVKVLEVEVRPQAPSLLTLRLDDQVGGQEASVRRQASRA